MQADWEDMTGSTPLEVNKDVVHFTTKVSALFWILVIHDQQRYSIPRTLRTVYPYCIPKQRLFYSFFSVLAPTAFRFSYPNPASHIVRLNPSLGLFTTFFTLFASKKNPFACSQGMCVEGEHKFVLSHSTVTCKNWFLILLIFWQVLQSLFRLILCLFLLFLWC